MRRILISVVSGLLLCVTPALAQEDETKDSNRAAWQHRWALQFAVTNATLQSFNGATISLRRHFGQGSAMRLGVTLGPVTFAEYATEGPNGNRSEESNGQAAGLELEYIGYLGPKSNVSPHLLIGAGTSVSRAETEDAYYSRWWNASVTAGFGVEWFVHRRVAISGEYVAGMVYSDGYTDSYYNGQYSYRTDVQRLEFGNSKVRMGVAVSL